MANSSFAFWNFLEFFLNIFYPQFIESTNVKPMDMEGRLNCHLAGAIIASSKGHSTVLANQLLQDDEEHG